MIQEAEKEREAFDRSSAGNYIWANAVKIDPSTIKSTDTWFNAQFKLLDESWQKYILDVEHQTLPSSDMEGDVVQFEYLPWVDRLISMTRERDLPLREDRIRYLELRHESMEQLLDYLRSAYTDESAYGRYIQKDSAFREMAKDNPLILS